MEALQFVLRSRTLQHLGELENRVNSVSRKQADIEQKLREIEELRIRVLNLSSRKDELLRELRHLPTDSLGTHMQKDVSCLVDSEDSFTPQQQKEVVDKATKQEKLRQLHYQLVAHRCAGCTASITLKVGAAKATRIRFETSYKGEYFDPFYLEIEFVCRKIKLSWHTIPLFVPLDGLVNKYNTGQIHFTTMMCFLHSYLTAFIHRREQAAEFSSSYSEYLVEEVASFYSYNFIQLVLAIPVEGNLVELVLHLHYNDLQSDLPSKVRCSSPRDLPVDRARIKMAFMTLPIAEAFQHLLLDQNIEQG